MTEQEKAQELAEEKARRRFSPTFYVIKDRYRGPNYPVTVSAAFVSAGGMVPTPLPSRPKFEAPPGDAP